MKILILCTGNSCRSQMAEGIIKSINKDIEVYSAGTNPSSEVHPFAIKAMREIGVNISTNEPHSVEKYLEMGFNYVITVCSEAKEFCPVFSGKVKHQLHIGFDDPAEAKGTENEIYSVFIRVRDEIIRDFTKFIGTI